MIYFIVLSALTLSCSDSDFRSKVVDVNNSLNKSNTENVHYEEESIIESDGSVPPIEDEEKVSVPEMISGTYLVRECIELNPENNEAVILCRVLDAQSKEKSSALFEWTFSDAEGQAPASEYFAVSYLDTNQSWHIEIKSSVPLKVTVKLSNENQAIDESNASIKGEDQLLGQNLNHVDAASGDEKTENLDGTEQAGGSEITVTEPTITESFTGNTYNELAWEEYHTAISFENDSLKCYNSDTNPLSHSGIISKTPHNYTGGYASIEVRELSTLKAMEAQPFIWGLRANADNRVHFLIEGETLIARYFKDGGFTNIFSRPYIPANDRFFRISHSIESNTLIFEVSQDGVNWSLFAVQNSSWDLASVLFEYNCGAWGAFSGQFGSTVDNISLYLPKASQ